MTSASRERPERQHHLGTMETGTGPNTLVCMDFAGPFPEREGFVNILVISCMSTKFSRAFATKTQSAAEVTYVFLHG